MKPLSTIIRVAACCVAALSVSLVRADTVSEPLSMKRTVIAGQVTDPAALSAMTLNFCDVLNDDRAGIRIPEDGSFHVATEILTGHEMTINAGRWIKFYTQPGDSVYLTIDPARLDHADGVLFSGARSEFNNQLRRFLIAFPDWGNYSPLDDNLTPEAYMAQVKGIVGGFLSQIQDYKAEHGLLPEVEDFLSRDIRYTVANGMLSYGRDELSGLVDTLGVRAVFLHPFWEIENPENFRTMLFPYHLSACVQALMLKDGEFVRLTREGDVAARQRRTAEVLRRLPASLCREVILWKAFSYVFYEPESYLTLPPLTEIFTEPLFAREFAARYQKLIKPEKVQRTLLEGLQYMDRTGEVLSLEPLDFFEHLASQYTGKAVYLDIWATWCGPCLVEMPGLPALETDLAEKGVILVSLCMQSSQDMWLSRIEEYSIGGERYYLDDQASRLFLGAYSLSGFPAYVLIGRDGEILTMKAPRPSEKEKLFQRIGELL